MDALSSTTRIRLDCTASRVPLAGSGSTRAQHVGDKIEFKRPAATVGRFRFFRSRQRGHGVDLAEQLVGGLLELGEVEPQRMLVVRVHVLDAEARCTP